MMTEILMIILIFMLILISFNKNFLSFLIMIEYMVISILFFMMFFNYMNLWIYLIYLILSVCEAILGLSLMVSFSFSFGHQKIEFINLMC
uniref:NADH dehydrogenase subunit 4L n=1 Tax=Nomada goodeniana TaxID=544954 RepID=A0A0S2LTH1_9HYME|nr:NADH dehydrogenase subunit 4L [Nomada goodeniana]